MKDNTTLALGSVSPTVARPWAERMKDYLQFMKIRLSLTVVFELLIMSELFAKTENDTE